jgi:hypothetical protein
MSVNVSLFKLKVHFISDSHFETRDKPGKPQEVATHIFRKKASRRKNKLNLETFYDPFLMF